MKRYAIGLDYGTNSCRSVIINADTGEEIASHVFSYPQGLLGVIVDEKDHNVAKQSPKDYLAGLEAIIVNGVSKAKTADSEFSIDKLIGIGIDTTGSTPMPVDQHGTPLALLPEFENNINANAWLWKDHTSHKEAELITELAKEMRPQFLAKCGGTYSSEWFWAKVLRCKHVAPEVFEKAYSFVELCDYIPAVLSGIKNPKEIKRSVCAAGHKAMYSDTWGGLPDKEFLSALDPELAELRDRLYDKAYPSDVVAGELCAEWADKLGLPAGITISVGAFDAHMGAVGAGIKEGTLVKILGTSTCDMMVMNLEKDLADIPGVCGIAKESVLPGYYGIEAGQSAVGDIFLWFVNNLVPESYGESQGAKFQKLDAMIAEMQPGETGLLALDWNNGNRTILVDPLLSGMLIGQTLYTKPHEIYRALIEATAFGALTIIKRIEEYGVTVEEVINCGGLAIKSPILMQIYSDITNRPMKIAASEQTCAMGAAIFSLVAAGEAKGGYATMKEAIDAISGLRDIVYTPIPENVEKYKKLYSLYMDVHDAFGTKEWSGNLAHVMKELIALKK
jgi:L-ribulokinase